MVGPAIFFPAVWAGEREIHHLSAERAGIMDCIFPLSKNLLWYTGYLFPDPHPYSVGYTPFKVPLLKDSPRMTTLPKKHIFSESTLVREKHKRP